ncbi:MORN repeat-containing protein 3-like [Anastrepha ludens]|uniref:MORN repeat-containing protein 3-like n=1 Tax=Anastrepha ludens TaxID=28586 RepID=UPI0023B0FA46|nr:MORN repeat-containing protein 3-like [Anastrepha ludens]
MTQCSTRDKFRVRCVLTCERKNHIKAQSTGARAAFFFPGSGTYKGYWLRSQHHRYGVKETQKHLIYDGEWRNGKRQGYGTMRNRLPNGTAERIYIGEWQNDMKWGEGKQFFHDGVYYGWWQKNRRHGLGVMWYKDGSIYMGEWEADVKHGVGVHFYENGNRYEGHYARGFKNGEGTFYHMHTGQIQKGMWENDVCKASMVMDDFRNQVEKPTPYPIPKLGLEEPDKYVCQLFQQYIPNAFKPTKSFNELKCLSFAHKMKNFTKFEPKSVTTSKLKFDVKLPCTCKAREK